MMPFTPRPPADQAAYPGPPRRRRFDPTADVAASAGITTSVSSVPGPPDETEKSPGPAVPASPKAKREKRQPTGDYPEGYCRTPVRTRFQDGNPGGPGRPRKNCKSQDELMRDELLKMQPVTEGGRRRRKTVRELVPGLLVRATLQKLNTKELRALQEEGRRLFPERDTDDYSSVAHDPQEELNYLREMIAMVSIGEAAGPDTDVLADFVTSVIEGEGGAEDDEAWNEGDWDAGDEEMSDEAAV